MSADPSTEGWALKATEDAPLADDELIRPIGVDGLQGYVHPLGVEPGQTLTIHVTAPAAHRISAHRLGRHSILDLDSDDAADRAEALLLGEVSRDRASRHPVRPGSYGHVGGPALERPSSASAWTRLWRLPSVNEVWNWSALVGDFDFPGRCHWVLAVDDRGRPGVYVGLGAEHDPSVWLFAENVDLKQRLGDWVHLAFTTDSTSTVLWVDGVPAATGHGAPAVRRATGGAVRLAAAAESGVVDHLLDADLTAVMLFDRPLSPNDVRRLAEDRGLSSPRALGLSEPVACWPLRERRGDRLEDVSGGGRPATLVNGATLGIPGPSASTSIGRHGYDPDDDSARGGAVRFSSDDLLDCGWSTAAELTVPKDAASGTYAVRVALVGADDELWMPFVVVRSTPRRQRAVALLFPTFTWLAYARRPINDVVVPGLASSFYSHHLNGRLFFHLGFRLPLTRARPFLSKAHRPEDLLHHHLVRPERFAEAWLEREGYAFECITDVELDREPGLLDRFAALMIAGHSEYWTSNMRDGLERHLAGGGGVLSLSGNTLYWRVSYDAPSASVEARKTSHAGEADPWLSPSEWGERWHSDGEPGGTWTLIGRPAHELLGLETLGWIDNGDAASFAPFAVHSPAHFLMHEPEEVVLTPDGSIGTECLNGPAASGYEMDGLPEALVMSELRGSDGRILLAHADGQSYIERFTREPGYGADVIYWERPKGGRVFNAGSIAWTGSLPVDPGVAALTRNALHHMGVARK